MGDTLVWSVCWPAVMTSMLFSPRLGSLTAGLLASTCVLACSHDQYLNGRLLDAGVGGIMLILTLFLLIEGAHSLICFYSEKVLIVS